VSLNLGSVKVEGDKLVIELDDKGLSTLLKQAGLGKVEVEVQGKVIVKVPLSEVFKS